MKKIIEKYQDIFMRVISSETLIQELARRNLLLELDNEKRKFLKMTKINQIEHQFFQEKTNTLYSLKYLKDTDLKI